MRLFAGPFLFLMVVCLGISGCSRATPKPPPRANNSTVFSLVEYQGGRMGSAVKVPSDAAVFKDLVAYVNSSGIAKGESTSTSYAPSFLIETDAVQVNIMGKQVVVSTRDSVDAVWHPVVRAKSSDDSQIESKVREFLRALPPKDGSNEATPPGSVSSTTPPRTPVVACRLPPGRGESPAPEALRRRDKARPTTRSSDRRGGRG